MDTVTQICGDIVYVCSWQASPSFHPRLTAVGQYLHTRRSMMFELTDRCCLPATFPARLILPRKIDTYYAQSLILLVNVQWPQQLAL